MKQCARLRCSTKTVFTNTASPAYVDSACVYYDRRRGGNSGGNGGKNWLTPTQGDGIFASVYQPDLMPFTSYAPPEEAAGSLSSANRLSTSANTLSRLASSPLNFCTPVPRTQIAPPHNRLQITCRIMCSLFDQIFSPLYPVADSFLRLHDINFEAICDDITQSLLILLTWHWSSPSWARPHQLSLHERNPTRPPPLPSLISSMRKSTVYAPPSTLNQSQPVYQ
jgi:hypothetical protein